MGDAGGGEQLPAHVAQTTFLRMSSGGGFQANKDLQDVTGLCDFSGYAPAITAGASVTLRIAWRRRPA